MSDTIENSVFIEGKSAFISGKEYPLINTGRRQASQVARITKWAGKYGQGIYEALQSQNGAGDREAGLGVLLNILSILDTDAMLDLFTALIGCSEEETELFFDAAALVEAGIVVYEHPTIKRLLDRFFSTSASAQEEQQESSMMSE